MPEPDAGRSADDLTQLQRSTVRPRAAVCRPVLGVRQGVPRPSAPAAAEWPAVARWFLERGISFGIARDKPVRRGGKSGSSSLQPPAFFVLFFFSSLRNNAIESSIMRRIFVERGAQTSSVTLGSVPTSSPFVRKNWCTLPYSTGRISNCRLMLGIRSPQPPGGPPPRVGVAPSPKEVRGFFFFFFFPAGLPPRRWIAGPRRGKNSFPSKFLFLSIGSRPQPPRAPSDETQKTGRPGLPPAKKTRSFSPVAPSVIKLRQSLFPSVNEKMPFCFAPLPCLPRVRVVVCVTSKTAFLARLF